jgi:pyridoxal phosphate enzyme (YggS family)
MQNIIQKNYDRVLDDIDHAARLSNRNTNDINLVAVSKKQPIDRIEAMLQTGHRLYGENRVQEALERWEERRKKHTDLTLHLIGSLQTNKVKDAVSLFDVIETLDRPKLAKALAAEMQKQNKFLPCFIQVNTGYEKQKAGITPDQLVEFITFCRDAGLNIIGLMCIPPQDEPAAIHFALLQKLAKENGLKELSMGMSEDFKKAIPLGATFIRVGTKLFGERDL